MTDTRKSNFRVFDAIIRSDIDLPELDPCPGPSADFAFSLAPARAPQEAHDWFHHWYRDASKSRIDSSIARDRGGYRLRFRDRADFLILEGGRQILCEPCPDTPRETIRHLLLDQVLPRVLAQRGDLILHASAVELADGSGIAFVGKSGSGKSTLAHSFGEVGGRLLGDDCLKLSVESGALIGVPAYGGSRLWEDSIEALFPHGVSTVPVAHYSSKRRISAGAAGAGNATTVRALFFLDAPERVESDEPVIQVMSGSHAIAELIRCSFLLDVKSVDSATEQFDAIRGLVSVRPTFYSLQYPRDYSRLPHVRQAILDSLGGSGPRAA